MITVSQLWTYPFKSGKGTSLPSTGFDSSGMHNDRRMVSIDKNGVFVTARRCSRLLQLSSTKADHGWLLQHPSMEADCQINTSEPSASITGRVWQDNFDGLDAGDEAAAWLSELLEIEVRIALWKEQSRYSGKYQFETTFADASPMLLTSEASVSQACEWGGIQPDVRRFRPNIVVKGVDAFAEDQWRHIRIGDITFEVLDSCTRCILTTRDPDSGEAHANKQPMLALMENHANSNRQPLLGVNVKLAKSAGEAVISVGDEVVFD